MASSGPWRDVIPGACNHWDVTHSAEIMDGVAGDDVWRGTRGCNVLGPRSGYSTGKDKFRIISLTAENLREPWILLRRGRCQRDALPCEETEESID